MSEYSAARGVRADHRQPPQKWSQRMLAAAEARGEGGPWGQTAFALARKSGLLAGMSGAERLALFLAALCHDIEHPGVSASFLLRSGSNMAAWCARGAQWSTAARAALVIIDRIAGRGSPRDSLVGAAKVAWLVHNGELARRPRARW